MSNSSRGRLTLIVIAVTLIGVLAWRQYIRMTTPLTWVTTTALAPGVIISANLIEQQQSRLGVGSITSPQTIIGHELVSAKAKGEPFFAGDLKRVARAALSQTLPEGRVMYTLNPQGSQIAYNNLRRGDRIDVLAVAGNQARIVARDVYLLGYIPPANKGNAKGRSALVELAKPPSKNSADNTTPPLMLAVYPDDIFPLAEIRSNERVALVLHGSKEVQAGKLLDIVPAKKHRQIELIIGLEKQNVRVTHDDSTAADDLAVR